MRGLGAFAAKALKSSFPASFLSSYTASMSRTLFVTTALPYANGSFHLGHILEYIQADIWVRAMRMAGHPVHFGGADDAHAAPIMLQAASSGLPPHAPGARYAGAPPPDPQPHQSAST